jgi:hypothetical protein
MSLQSETKAQAILVPPMSMPKATDLSVTLGAVSDLVLMLDTAIFI